MIHKMRLSINPFTKIQSGKKTVESRVLDEKRKLFSVGDEIVITLVSDESKIVKVKIVNLFKCKTFSELLDTVPLTLFGGDSREDLVTEFYSFYSKEEETACGVLGIEVQCIN